MNAELSFEEWQTIRASLEEREDKVTHIPITQVREYCMERDFPNIKTLGDFKAYRKHLDGKVKLFMRDGKLWLRQTIEK